MAVSVEMKIITVYFFQKHNKLNLHVLLPFIMFGWVATDMVIVASRQLRHIAWSTVPTGGIRGSLIPGAIYTFTISYQLPERALCLSLVIATGPLGGAFGGCIACAVGSLDRVRDLEAWR
ncbi:uncharacterized protein EV420DRAFT_1083355 [Desarmillaria tabescens]|uniref:Uncharacterized protein n=1 Tax=Armillaria tabescens TaxID=1929756 RepID=A0AA39MP81_ARMTA|nr:uncharacterized protein EV420DRAFT_1083355 [Desarmillaria tabescens]KAK0442021.1 hypothetical protein EV420DRAFT_1083355 [Desarmillaria tabescens]